MMKKFFVHLEDPAPGFRCRVAGAVRGDKLQWSMRVSHRKGRPATAADLALLKKQLATNVKDITDLYARHDGLKLYMGKDRTMALEFFPIRAFAAQSRKMRDWGDDFEETPDKARTLGLAIGKVGHSSDYFALHGGRLYFVPHDSHSESLGSLSSFLTALARDPAQMLARLGGGVRYSDGSTHRQWYPEKYQGDIEATEPPKGSKAKPCRNVMAVVFFASGKSFPEPFHNQGGGMGVKDCAKSILESVTRSKVMTVSQFMDTKRASSALLPKPLMELNPECNRFMKVELHFSQDGKNRGKLSLSGKALASLPKATSANQLAEWLVERIRPLMSDEDRF